MIIRTSRMATVLALACCAAAASPAFATNSPPPAPAPSPAPSTSNSTSKAEAAAAAAAAAAARAAASSRATGGRATGGAATVGNVGSSSHGGAADLDSSIDVDAPANSSLIDSSSNKSSAWSLFLPPPVFTPPMAPVQCPSATITQDATSVVMGVYSNANAKTDTSDCTLIQVRNAKVEACQYASAKQIEDLLVAKHLPAFKATSVVMTDYTDQECSVLKSAIARPDKPAAPVPNLLQPPITACTAEQPKPPAAAPKDKQRKRGTASAGKGTKAEDGCKKS